MSQVYFLKLGDLHGDCTHPAHEGWIEVLSFSLTPDRSGSQTSQRQTKREEPGEVQVTKTGDGASRTLWEALTRKTRFQTAHLASPGLRLLLLDVQISSMFPASGGRDVINLSYQRVSSAKAEKDMRTGQTSPPPASVSTRSESRGTIPNIPGTTARKPPWSI